MMESNGSEKASKLSFETNALLACDDCAKERYADEASGRSYAALGAPEASSPD